jgi:hypothetical protein
MISISDLSSVFFGERKGFLMILAVYADDSADQRRQTVFTVGGFMGFPQMFAAAERKWKKYLDDHQLEYFKASEAQNLDGQFDSLKRMLQPRSARAFAESVRHDLGKIIAEEHLGGIALSLEIPAFKKVLREQLDAEQYFGTSDCCIYMFRQFIVNCIELMNRDWPESSSTQIAVVFDDHSNWRQAEYSYQTLRGDPLVAPRLGAISHANDRTTIALQMADLCAYEGRYQTLNVLGLAPERPEFTRMATNHAWYAFSMFREEHLLKNLDTARRFDEQQRVRGVQRRDEHDSPRQSEGRERSDGTPKAGELAKTEG